MPVLTLPAGGATSLTVRAKAIVFEDPRSRAVLSRIEQVAPSEATILLTGETGTGKEIVARQIHDLSRRARGPFIAINCGAFSENLVESELFGHQRGAFTGALESKAGWFEAASGGTLFLDEVGDLPLSLQVKLLRVLQEGEVVRLGSRQAIPVDVRLIAATNVDLQEAMAAGHFREDLFYRLNVVALSLPPLRERPGDIEPLARYFVELYRKRLGLEEVELLPEAVQRFLAHSWPGNIRELENTVHHALLVCRGGRIEAEDVRVTINSGRRTSSSPPPPLQVSAERAVPDDAFAHLEQVLARVFEVGGENLHQRIDERLMAAAYRFCDQNQLQTARLLGISRNVVRARLIQHGLLSGARRGSLDSGQPPPEPDRCEPSSERPASVLRIGYQLFGRLVLVKALGDLERRLAVQGVRLEWFEFPGGLQLVDALHEGRLDFGVVGECPPVFAQAASTPIVYVASEPAAPEAEAIIVPRDSRVRSVAELRGRSIALNRGANVHYLVLRALEEVGLCASDVDVRFLAPEEAQVAFREGQVDAWAIWDPWLSSVQETMGARVLRDGRGLTKNETYYVARKEWAQAVPEIVESVLAAVEQVTSFAQHHPAEAARVLSEESGMDAVALEAWLSGLKRAGAMTRAKVEAQQRLADRLFGLNLVSNRVRVADAQWSPSVAV